MKRSTLSLLSLLLAAIMLMGIFASCTTGSVETEGTSNTEPSEDGKETSKPEDGGDEDETKDPSGGEVVGPNKPNDGNSIDSSLIVNNANSLANGVNAYFTDGKRTDFVLENQNMNLSYALAANKKQLITSLTTKDGKSYIESTSDVFVRMTNGNTFYASNSTRPATANLYRFGYYMYEARFEEQIFMSAPIEEDAINVSIASVGKNGVKVISNADGSINVTITDTYDPYIALKNISYTADDYPYLQITMKANIKSTRSVEIYVATDSHALSNATSVLASPSDEYFTYNIPLFRTSWYTGKVSSIRIDFPTTAASKGEVYDIKEVKIMKGNPEGTPEDLGLNRSFFVYSDKMHQMIQIASGSVATENIASVGVETRIAKSTVAKLIVKDANGTHTTLEGVDWDSAEYAGFDVIDAGIFGYILPAGEKTDKLEITEDGDYYVIIQSRTPENGTIQPSGVWNASTGRYDALVDDNANDFYMGQRLYTDETHDFDTFLLEAHIERNPLGEKNFILNRRDSSFEATYECPNCGDTFDRGFNQCSSCYEMVTSIEHPNIYYRGYDPLRGIYSFHVPSEGFSPPYFQYPNKYIDLTFAVRGDNYDRNIYFMASSTSGCLECAAILDANKMLIPVPVEVGKNFSESGGERNLWNIQDNLYGESIIPILVESGSNQTYTMLNLYQNWGQYPLKQVSWIQFYAPYYHLSTGVTESNCIVPYYSCKNSRGLGTLPDHRAMSAHLWSGQPQHTSGGSHRWLMYTDANGVYSASENTLDYIDSYGPIYADVYMDYLSDDGNIKVSYTHMEFPQTDENRAYYEMKYEVLGDVSFKNFSRDFCFYDVGDNDSKGSYVKVGYLNENNESTIVNAAVGNESFKYTLGTECPYFSFFDMPDYNVNSTSAEGFVNLSFLIYNYDIVINGQKSDAKFAIINEDNRVRLSLDLGEVTLKKGDTITINAIVMPWGDETLNYDIVGDKNVRDVRVNTLLNPLTPTAVENAEIIESVFLPKVKSTNGKSATFTLTGGHNNVAVRVYGFNKLTVPVVEELVDGEWVPYRLSSAYKPDKFGYAYYYDGYSVHYDADGTYSYAFIVPMDYTDADGRTLRVTAEESFTGWPSKLPEIEIEAEELPMNVFEDASSIFISAKSQAGKAFGNIALSSDGTYVTLSSNEKKQEAYFNIWGGTGGQTVTGQYLVMKYRLPSTNNRKHTYFEIFTNTDGAATSQSCFSMSNVLINNGEWHTLVIDLSTWGSDRFKANESDEYRVRFVRIDLYNEYYTDGNSIDLEFFGISDDIEEILAYEAVDSIQLLTEKNKITSYDKDGNVIDTPKDGVLTPGSGMEDADSGVPGYNVFIGPSDLYRIGKNTAWQDSVFTNNDEGYTTFKNQVNATTDERKMESYFTVYNSTGNQATGRYAIIKYRSNVQEGYITFWSSTQNASASSGNSVDLSHDSGLFIADNQWHIIVVDLAKLIPTFKATSDGKYGATHLRVDFFNFGEVRDPSLTVAQVDVAYLGICDDYTEILKSDKSVSEVFFYNGYIYKFSSATGELTYAPEDKPNPDEPVLPDVPSNDSPFTKYFNATSIIEASQQGGGHIGASELIESGNVARIFNCTNESASTAGRLESYFYLLSSNTEVTGQYLVLKYRAEHQVGYIQVYTSTESNSASNSNVLNMYNSTGLFTADNKWHVVIIDLAEVIPGFSANADGKYVAQHLRLDLFNFGSPNSETSYVDLAYVALCEDYSNVITSDKSVDKVIFYDGSLKEISTSSGTTLGTPNFIINSAALANQTEKAGLTHALSADGSYVTYTQTVNKDEGFAYVIYPNANVNVPQAATGQYIMLKYRTTWTGTWQMYIGANNGSVTAQGGKDSFSLGQKNGEKGAIVSDGEWQYLIINATFITTWGGFLPESDGSYQVDYYRIDFFNEKSETAHTVDLQYVVMADSIENLVSYAGMDSYTYVSTYNGGVINETVEVNAAE